MEDTAQKEAMVDTVARDLLMPATAMVVMEEDTEELEVVMEVSEVVTEVLEVVTEEDTEVSAEDTEEVMEVTMVDMDTEPILHFQRPFDSPEPSSFIMSSSLKILYEVTKVK